jgi:hypothetical protein
MYGWCHLIFSDFKTNISIYHQRKCCSLQCGRRCSNRTSCFSQLLPLLVEYQVPMNWKHRFHTLHVKQETLEAPLILLNFIVTFPIFWIQIDLVPFFLSPERVPINASFKFHIPVGKVMSAAIRCFASWFKCFRESQCKFWKLAWIFCFGNRIIEVLVEQNLLKVQKTMLNNNLIFS